MLLKQSTGSHRSPLPKRLSAPALHIEGLPSARPEKIFSQRVSNLPAATKRLTTIETPRKSRLGKGSRLTFSKNLFR